MKFIKKVEGAISIFLCIILTAMLVLTGVVVDGSRIRAGESQVQGAVDSAAKSVVADYNNALKDLYGIFALAENNPDALKEELEHYLNRTLMTELGIDKKTMGDKTYDYLKKMFTGDGKFEDVNFFNMYDYNVEDAKVTPLYNLSENPVMRKQIVDYMKYRGPKVLIEGFMDKLISMKGFRRQTEVMNQKVEVDKELGEIRKLQESLTKNIEGLNGFNADTFKKNLNDYVTNISMRIKYEKERVRKDEERKSVSKDISAKDQAISDKRKAISEAEKNKQDTTSLKADLSRLQSERSELQTKYDKLTKEYDELTQKINSHNTASDNLKTQIINGIDTYYQFNTKAYSDIEEIISKAGSVDQKLTNINNQLDGDTTDFATKMKDEVSQKKSQISPDELIPIKDKISDNIKILENFRSKVNVFNHRSVTHEMVPFATENYSEIYANIQSKVAVNTLISDYINKYNIIEGFQKIEPVENKDVPDPRKDADSFIKGSDNPLNNEELNKKKEKKLPDDLPSKKKVTSPDFTKQDQEYISAALQQAVDSSENPQDTQDDMKALMGDMGFSDNKTDSSEKGLAWVTELFKVIEKGLEGMRDELYVNEYAMGMFKNTITDKFANDPNKKIEPERDLRDNLKSTRKTFFEKSEIEYILIGSSDENMNAYAVQGEILLIRFALNTIYIYLDAEKYQQAMWAATAIAGWTGFGVPIVHTVIMLGWSMAESILDVKYLMDGERVPIFKTKDTWVLGKEGAINKLKETAEEKAKEAAKQVVDYAVDEAKDAADAAISRVIDIIENKINIVVDKTFAPVEKIVDDQQKYASQAYDGAISDLQNPIGGQQNQTMNDIEKKIYEVAQQQFNSMNASLKEQIINKPAKEAREIIENAKKSVKIKANEAISSLQLKLINEITTAADAGKEKLNNYIDSIGGTSKGGTVKNDIKTSLFSLCYQDYLRIFLFVQNKDSKMNRIEDLIQLNMREEGYESFKMSECNTYIRVEAAVSMKYLFMTQAFVKREVETADRNRYPFKVLTYQGY
ncbi:MAG: DUF5702 domain-containing protein [Clostridia bacterium]|nr:DUF5702 domain-containing protein [Clostridia bacterium]